MKKKASKGIQMLAVLLAVFSVIAFVIPFPKNLVFWIAYACGVFAIVFQLYIFKTSFSDADARSRFYGFPIARLGAYYLIIQLIFSIVEIALSKFLPSWIVILINALILAVALIGCITTETMRDEIARQDGKLKHNVSGMRNLQSLTASMVDQSNDPEMQKLLKKVADEFRYSDPLTSEKTADLEIDMRGQIGDLQQALAEEDSEAAKTLCNRLLQCLKERNRISALSK